MESPFRRAQVSCGPARKMIGLHDATRRQNSGCSVSASSPGRISFQPWTQRSSMRPSGTPGSGWADEDHQVLEGIRQILWREVMSTPRIAEAPIAELKAWMEQNRTQLAARNINRIDGYYNDDDLDNWCVDDIDNWCVDDINAYHQTGSDFGEPTIELTKDEISSIT